MKIVRSILLLVFASATLPALNTVSPRALAINRFEFAGPFQHHARKTMPNPATSSRIGDNYRRGVVADCGKAKQNVFLFHGYIIKPGYPQSC